QQPWWPGWMPGSAPRVRSPWSAASAGAGAAGPTVATARRLDAGVLHRLLQHGLAGLLRLLHGGIVLIESEGPGDEAGAPAAATTLARTAVATAPARRGLAGATGAAALATLATLTLATLAATATATEAT